MFIVLRRKFQLISLLFPLGGTEIKWEGGGRVGGNAYANLYAEKWGCGGFLLGEGEGRATRRPHIDTHNPQFLYWL